MGDGPNTDQQQWMTTLRKVSGRPDQPPAASPAAHPGGTSARLLVPVEKSLSLIEAPIKTTYVTVKLGISLKFKGSLELASGPKGDGSVDVTAAGYSDGFVERLGKTWYAKDGVKVLGVNTGASESKIEGQAKVKDGLEVSISASLKFNSGEELKLKFTAVQIGKDWKVTAGQLEGNYVFKSIELKAYLFENVTFKGTIQAVAVVKGDPNYAAIAATIGENAGAVATGARALGAFLTFDAIITIGFVANAVLIVIGGTKAMLDGAEIRELPKKLDIVTTALVNGFTAGVQGDANNPAGSVGQAGFDKGKEGYAKLCDQMRAKVPDATEDEMKEAIRPALPKFKGAIYDTMHELARQAVWEGWASQKTGFLDSKEDLKFGWSAIYGKLPSAGDALYTKYYKP